MSESCCIDLITDSSNSSDSVVFLCNKRHESDSSSDESVTVVYPLEACVASLVENLVTRVDRRRK